jgi:hypothetical protein
MKRRKPIFLIAALLLLIVPLAFFLRKPAPLDLSNDEEPFKSMVLPPKLVQAGYYMDGGSVTVQVTDQRGMVHAVTFPFDHDGVITSYKTAFEGNIDDTWKKPPLKNPARAKAIMIRLLKDYGDKQDEYYEFTLRKFSEPPAEIGEKIFWNVRKIFN